MNFSSDIIHIAAFMGAGLSVSLASVASGIGVGYIAEEASYAVMKQPKVNEQMFKTMLIGQAATGTGGIFSLVIALLLLFGGLDSADGGWFKVAALFSAGLAMGFGSIGPVFGAGYAGGQACKSVGRMPKKSNEIMGNMLIGQALAQTSSIFALVVSLLLLYSTPQQSNFPGISLGEIITRSIALLGAGLSIGFGTIGPGTGIGYVAGRANDMLGRYPKQRPNIMKTMFLGAAVSESTAIYSLVISLLLLFAVK